jgi:xylulokinase
MTGRVLVAGVDSSTQATKIVVCDSETGEIVREGQASHPEGTEVDPDQWWRAFRIAAGGNLFAGVEAIGVAGQQHGLVALNEHGNVVRPALLWNDTRSAQAADDLINELGGSGAWADAVGSVPVAAFTISKLRWLAEHEPEHARRTAEVLLPHDWLTGRLLAGQRADRVVPGAATTDRGDASGTGYWSPSSGDYRIDLVERAFGGSVALPQVLAPEALVGQTPDGIFVSVGTGDNMAAALGLAIRPGDIVVSLGTSGTVFATHDRPTADASALVAGFADATGRFLPLVCTLNAARVLGATATLLRTDLEGLAELALAAEPGAGGLSFLPYLDGERTPDLPHATGTLGGITRDNATSENLARAAVEGMLCGLADGVDALVDQGVEARRILLIGGAARSQAVKRIAPEVFGAPVVVPRPAEFVAVGAARQAAWALSPHDGPPTWTSPSDEMHEPKDRDATAEVRAKYRDLRDTMHAPRATRSRARRSPIE